MTPSEFTDLDWNCINTIRLLSADQVQKANSGHPGAPMGLAPLAHVLFSRFLRCDPQDPKWVGRDRFVLSNGHSCALLYSMLHLLGYDLSMDDLKAFRQIDSKTPGHPEAHMTPGIEVTTGPLGQGFANSVGLAIGEAHMAATFNQSDLSLFDNYTYVFAGDGCMQEGIASEAASLAGHLGLGRLIVFYDDNHITIDGGTDLSFTEDVELRFKAYGFHTQFVGDGDHDLEGIARAIEAARAVTDKPSLIRIRTTIGFGSNVQGSAKAHGAPLGSDALAAVKSHFGFDPSQSFVVPEEVSRYYSVVCQKGAESHHVWDNVLSEYERVYPELAAELNRRLQGKLPANLAEVLPKYSVKDSAIATRKLSETVLCALSQVLPEIVGGSADLTPSNLTKWKGSVDFQKPGPLGSYAGRYIRYGVREHAMFAIGNGIFAYGGLIPFTSTFLNFISYGMGAVRLAALSHFHQIFIMTHDSIGLGEDGPTHQPIETLAALRAMPGLLTIRPADGNEVSGAYLVALKNKSRPSVLALSRQNLPQLEGTSIEAVQKGAYVLSGPANPKLVLVSTGSEVSLCVGVAKKLGDKAIRVVSMPCQELFNEQPDSYKRSVFPESVPVLSVEAATTFGWQKYATHCIGIDSFGSSGPYQEVYAKFGLTVDDIADKASKLC